MYEIIIIFNELSLLLRACLIRSNSYYNEIGIGILMNKNCNVIYIYIERERDTKLFEGAAVNEGFRIHFYLL